MAAMVHRALLYTTSSACPVWALLFADDWDICAQAPDLARHLLLPLLVLEVFQVPIQWRKCKGGHTYTWVGYEKCLQELRLGSSARRAAWIEQWMSRTLEQGCTTRKEMQEAVGRLVFVCGALSWDRPFLAPLFTLIHIGDLHASTPLPLFVKSILFWLRSRIRQRRSFPCHIDHQWKGVLDEGRCQSRRYDHWRGRMVAHSGRRRGYPKEPFSMVLRQARCYFSPLGFPQRSSVQDHFVTGTFS